MSSSDQRTAVLTGGSVLGLTASAMQQMQRLALSPETAFLLSRLDGKTDLATVGFMSGIELARVIELLQPLLADGVVQTHGGAAPAEAASGKKVGSILDLLEHEESDVRYSKITRDVRRDILVTFTRLAEANHYELLELKPKDKVEAIRNRYFAVSKKFHPDRYFSQDIGHYRQKVTRIFEKINIAYETLSDPASRALYDKQLGEVSGKASGEAAPAAAAVAPNPALENLNRARRYFQWGEEDYQQGNYVSAASNYLLAVHFDRENEEYQKAHKRVQPFVERRKVKDQTQKGQNKIDEGEYQAAYEMLKTVYTAHPVIASQDGEFMMKMARATLLAEMDLEKVAEYNLKAKTKARPGDLPYILVTTGMFWEKKGNVKAALEAYQQALEVDPTYPEAQALSKRLQQQSSK